MSQKSITAARDAWNLLRGLTCIYKPSDTASKSTEEIVKRKILLGLNNLERHHETRDQDGLLIGPGKALVPVDYSLHPLVIGDGFELDDIKISPLRTLDHRVGGVLLLTINDPKLKRLLKCQRFTRTYQVEIIVGEATDTCFVGGKILEKSTYEHLKGRRQILEKGLASIRSSFQRETYKYANVQLQSQEAYELAAKGPIKPDGSSPPIIFDLKCIDYSLPKITLEIECYNENINYIVELIAEIGARVKTSAVCEKIRCVRDGIFTLNDCLLVKHATLENILNNNSKLQYIIKQNNLKWTQSKRLTVEPSQIMQN